MRTVPVIAFLPAAPFGSPGLLAQSGDMNTESQNLGIDSRPPGSAVPYLDELLDINRAAKILGISPKTLRDHILHRRIDYVKLRGRVLIRQDTLWNLIERNTVRAQVQ